MIQQPSLNRDSEGDAGGRRKVRVSLSLSRELVEEIDALRGLISRSAIVEALLHLALRRVRRSNITGLKIFPDVTGGTHTDSGARLHPHTPHKVVRIPFIQPRRFPP